MIVAYERPEDTNHASDRKLQKDFYIAMRWAYDEIRKIQQAARSRKPIVKPRWPMIFLRSPKGWTGPKSLHGVPIEKCIAVQFSYAKLKRHS
jgi:xylulose-5-phosphate/fructose-6-phosphate phosphoketolase